MPSAGPLILPRSKVMSNATCNVAGRIAVAQYTAPASEGASGEFSVAAPDALIEAVPRKSQPGAGFHCVVATAIDADNSRAHAAAISLPLIRSEIADRHTATIAGRRLCGFEAGCSRSTHSVAIV